MVIGCEWTLRGVAGRLERSRERKRELTEPAKEFPKASARPSPCRVAPEARSEGPQATGSEAGCYFIGRALEQCSC